MLRLFSQSKDQDHEIGDQESAKQLSTTQSTFLAKHSSNSRSLLDFPELTFSVLNYSQQHSHRLDSGEISEIADITDKNKEVNSVNTCFFDAFDKLIGKSQSYQYHQCISQSEEYQYYFQRYRPTDQTYNYCRVEDLMNIGSIQVMPNLEQELQSPKIKVCQDSSQLVIKSLSIKNGLKVTKNVTKNLGKLLFKFIWKHRRTLGQQMGLSNQRWESFVKTIALWKKENNITREYLISRWHGPGAESALFRTISRHFFRKRCLPAIIKSNICLKQVHIQRIDRFSKALEDSSALDSLV